MAAQALAGILGLALASGVNLYLAVLVTGLAQRFHLVSGLPPELQVLAHPLVLLVAGSLYLLEFLADKVPFITPIWDFVHTAIRPVGGALLALAAAGRLHPALQALAMLAGGAIALSAHGTKMGVRLAAHIHPDPATHAIISTTEDLGVLGLLTLVWKEPRIAIAVALFLLLLMALLLPRLLRVLAFLGSALKGRVASWYRTARRTEIPGWAEGKLAELDPERRGTALRAWAWSVKGAPKLAGGVLVVARSEWHFVCRRWFRTRTIHLLTDLPQAVHPETGLVFDTLLLSGVPARRFFITKEWAKLLPET